MLFACLQELLPMNCNILEQDFFFGCLQLPLTILDGITEGQAWLTGITFWLWFMCSQCCWEFFLSQSLVWERFLGKKEKKKGLAEEGEKKGEEGCVEQGHLETLPLRRKQEFRMVSDLFQHAANVWRKIFFIHYCCSEAAVTRGSWRIQGHGELKKRQHWWAGKASV